MQSLFDTLHAAVGGRLSLTIGLALIGALFIQVVIEVGRGLLRLYYDRQQQRATLVRLQLQVQETRLRCHEVEQTKLVWNGYRKFTVARKVRECEDVHAFYLKPHDGKPLPSFKPGQYLPFQLDIPGRDKPLVRCYSLSDAPHRTDYYRVTIKKEKPPPDQPDLPPGAASSYF